MDVVPSFLDFLSRNNIELEVFSKYESLHDNAAKVKFVQNFLKVNNLMPDRPIPQVKNEVMSKMFRDSGNSLYQRKQYVDALICYNTAICFAGGENLGFGYANRSAVYFELQLYQQCLDNIRMAKEAGYPAQLLSKLEERERKCRAAMNTFTATPFSKVRKFQPELSYSVNAQCPSVADCVELVVDQKNGRHFVAKRDLKVGNIVILERPYQVYLDNKYSYQKCHNCLAENQMNLIPCPNCNKVMFCSQSCLESARKYHDFMCPIINSVYQKPISFLFFALRILLSHIHEVGSVEALIGIWKESSAKPNQASRHLKALGAFHELETNKDIRLRIEGAVLIAVAFTFLIEYTASKSKLKLGNVETQNQFLNILSQYYKICHSNWHVTEKLKRDKSGTIQNVPYALNICPNIGLLKHSCIPNTQVVTCNESLMAAMIIKPVKKGDQLSIKNVSQKPHLRMSRKEFLVANYHSVCDCEGCIKYFPTEFDFPKPSVPIELTPKDDWYQLPDDRTDFQIFQKCKQYLQQNGTNHSSQIVEVVGLGMARAYGSMCHNYSLSVKSD